MSFDPRKQSYNAPDYGYYNPQFQGHAPGYHSYYNPQAYGYNAPDYGHPPGYDARTYAAPGTPQRLPRSNVASNQGHKTPLDRKLEQAVTRTLPTQSSTLQGSNPPPLSESLEELRKRVTNLTTQPLPIILTQETDSSSNVAPQDPLVNPKNIISYTGSSTQGYGARTYAAPVTPQQLPRSSVASNQEQKTPLKRELEQAVTLTSLIPPNNTPRSQNPSPLSRSLEELSGRITNLTTPSLPTVPTQKENSSSDATPQNPLVVNPESITSYNRMNLGCNPISAKKPTKGVIEHENGIFGSYLLEDPKCLARIVNQYNRKFNRQEKINIDCFNYESINELMKTFDESNRTSTKAIEAIKKYASSYKSIDKKQVDDIVKISGNNLIVKEITRSHNKNKTTLNNKKINCCFKDCEGNFGKIVKTANELKNWYEGNKAELKNSHKGLKFEVHYLNKKNDLLQTSDQIVPAKEDWQKHNRFYRKNMVFFNPYLHNTELTKSVVNAFFKYANTNLQPDGVVTLMWNKNRTDRDHSGNIMNFDIEGVASDAGFKVIRELSGEHFSRMTNFRHLKNSSSLESTLFPKNIEQLQRQTGGNGGGVIVHNKGTDTLMLFKRTNEEDTIPEDNEIAQALVGMLS